MMIEQVMPDGFKRVVKFRGAFDKRHADPSKNYGIHGMELHFILVGPKGATQFLFYTNMMLPHVRKEIFDKHNGEYQRFDLWNPCGADIGYHAREAQYEGQTSMTADCEWVGGPCFYDGSSLRADEFAPTFLEKGDDAVWEMLREEYDHRFAVPSQETHDGK